MISMKNGHGVNAGEAIKRRGILATGGDLTDVLVDF